MRNKSIILFKVSSCTNNL